MPTKRPLHLNQFTCADCGQTKTTDVNSCTTGYGTFRNEDGTDKKVCFECCGKQDLQWMRDKGWNDMYLVKEGPAHYVTNWPGTLKIKVGNVKSSWHNMAGRDGRRDFWFPFEGHLWHGVNIGWGQVARCRKTKETYPWTPKPEVQPVAAGRALELHA